MENCPHALFSLIFLQLAVTQLAAVDITANGFGFAICQVCKNAGFFQLYMTFYNNSLF